MAPERRAAEAPGWLSRSAAVSWRLLVVAAAIGVVGFLLVYLRLVVLPVIVASLLRTLLAPPAGWLRARGWPPLAATWAVMGGAVLVIAGASAALAPHRAAPNPRHPALRPPGPGAPGGADQPARADPGPAFRGDAGGRGGHRGAAVAGAHVFLHQGRRPDGQLVRQPRRGAG